MIVISDAGPLNYLVLIGHADKLPLLYDRVLVPAAVVVELSRDQAPPSVRAFVLHAPSWLEVRPPAPTDPPLTGRDIGEQHAILLAERERADALLCDDRGARRIAKIKNITTIGTLGILLEAARRGLLDLSDAIRRLRQTNFRASEELYQEVLAADPGPKTGQRNIPEEGP